ncbi:MAG: PAS domain S-box protein [Chloroflexi bacterium]|nr:PAS domain S-box protein [Chloroflexota bacterium]
MPKTTKSKKQLAAENEALRLRLKDAEEALTAVDHSYRTLVESMRDGGLTLTAEGVILYANGRFAEMLKTPLHELIGSPIAAWMPPDSQEILAVMLNGGNPKRGEELSFAARDETTVPVYLSIERLAVADSLNHFCLVATDLTERKRTEQIMAARLRLLQFAAMHPLKELLQSTLDELEILTGSRIGFYHFLDADQETLLLQTWSTRTLQEICQAEGDGLHYNISEAGVWVDCIWERRPIIHNDYASLPHRTSLPEGHAGVTRELVVPVFRDGRIVAILGVGNKPENYTQHDVESVSSLADLVWDIAELKQAEENLRQSEGLLRLIADNLPAYTAYVSAPDLCYRFVNRQYEDALQRPREEIVGQPVSKVLSQANFEFAWPYIERALNGEACSYENVFSLANGQRWLQVNYVPNLDQTGKVNGLVLLNYDITERKQAVEALTASQELYRLLAENSTDAVTLIDVAGNVVYASPSSTRRLGYDENDLLQLDTPGILEFIHPEDRGRIGAEIVRGRQLKLPISRYEYRMRAKDGTYIWAEDILRREFDENGEFVRTIVSSRDITERKQAEEALRQSARQNATILATAMHGFWQVDPDTAKIIEVNEAYCRMSGYSREELRQMTIAQLEALEHTEDVAGHIEQIKNDTALHFETMHRRKDGSTFHVEISAQYLADMGTIFAFLQDISERKQREAEHDRFQAQLAQAQKMETVGRLAGGIAHDFNNLLAVMMLRTEMALQATDPATLLHRNLTEIYTTAQHSAELVRKLLGFARKQMVSPKVLNVNAAVESTLPMLKNLLSEEIKLVWRPDRQVWPVRIDPTQIDQILVNLCVNARDAIQGVGMFMIGTENIALADSIVAANGSTMPPGDYVMLTVSDTGSGIEKDLLAHIFEPFFTTKEIGKGTGLGLSVVDGIVQQNGGQVQVYSTPNLGTTFKVYLPRFADPVQVAEEERPSPPPLQSKGETVLLVEDEAAVLQMAADALRYLGYKVITAVTPDEAIYQMGNYAGTIDLLMTDIILPVMNGRELAERIIAIQPDIKILYVSGYPADFIAHRGVLEGGVHFLQKPFSLQKLASSLKEALVGTPY